MDESKENGLENVEGPNNSSEAGDLFSAPSSRREFLLKGMTLASALPLVLAAQTFSRTARAKGPAHVKPSNPQAKSLGFVLDGDKVNVKKWPKRAGADGKNQYCWDCMFYTPSPAMDATKSKFGGCAIFQGDLVPDKGWCNTWAQNPKYVGKKHA